MGTDGIKNAKVKVSFSSFGPKGWRQAAEQVDTAIRSHHPGTRRPASLCRPPAAAGSPCMPSTLTDGTHINQNKHRQRKE